MALSGARPETGRAELDIYLSEKDCHGRRYGTDSMRVVCRYGFTMMRLHGISLWVVPENVAAIGVCQKVGFAEEGTRRESFRRDGKWHDMILISLLEDELTGQLVCLGHLSEAESISSTSRLPVTAG